MLIAAGQSALHLTQISGVRNPDNTHKSTEMKPTANVSH